MANMAFGAYTLVNNPAKISVIKKNRYNAIVDTYSDVSHFSWTSTIVGKRLSLFWNFMTAAEFNTLNGYCEDNDDKVFDPQDGSAKTYNVKITSMDADYLIFLTSAAGVYRKDVSMEVLIISQV